MYNVFRISTDDKHKSVFWLPVSAKYPLGALPGRVSPTFWPP
jgi:hypothetical protein